MAKVVKTGTGRGWKVVHSINRTLLAGPFRGRNAKQRAAAEAKKIRARNMNPRRAAGGTKYKLAQKNVFGEPAWVVIRKRDNHPMGYRRTKKDASELKAILERTDNPSVALPRGRWIDGKVQITPRGEVLFRKK